MFFMMEKAAEWQFLARKADPDFEVIYEESREALLEHLKDLVQKGDTILVKASHFMKFEEVVEALEKM